MSTIPGSVVLFTVICLLAAFLVPCFTQPVLKRLNLSEGAGSLKAFALVLAPFLALWALAGSLKSMSGAGACAFVTAAALLYLLARLGLPSQLRGILLLLVSIGLSVNLPPGSQVVIYLSLASGLVVWKLSQSLLCEDFALDDVLPPLTWIMGAVWISESLPQSQAPEYKGLLMSVLAVAIFLRLVQSPLLEAGDRGYLKRLILSLTGGLLTLISITKLLGRLELCPAALLVGGGMLLAYILQSVGVRNKDGMALSDGLTAIALIGLFTLAGSALFSAFGWILLAASMVVSTRGSNASFAGWFWIGLGLLQCFKFPHHAGLTAINMAQVNAGLAVYAGMSFVMAMSLIMRDMPNRRLSLAIVLIASTAAALLSGVFLTSESTQCFLMTAVVGAVILAVFSPIMYRQGSVCGNGLLPLLPIQMATVAVLVGELFHLGS